MFVPKVLIDVYFENVGSKVFEAVFPLLNTKARVPVCGLISAYNATSINHSEIALAQFQGKSVMGKWVEDGKYSLKKMLLKVWKFNAFIGLLEGKNFAKL
ncbi:hypothetical protein CYY_007003 [Polysphondylium violaceum]|uniref:Uncharacterized protein n=1 Tax=Polysphondylium violaceum TaxID=133409 RepID=A0A8J4V2L9_9MYCE|nr:hypothetical protein CYY_007003 [Polysphondylium violaceum]